MEGEENSKRGRSTSLSSSSSPSSPPPPPPPPSSSSSSSSSSSIWAMFLHADALDVVLMALGSLGSIVDGLSVPVILILSGRIMNQFATLAPNSPIFTDIINKNAVVYLYMACIVFVVCFFEGYCWTRTGERQASRMRARYLRAVLSQDMEYFDLRASSTTDVVTFVSSDTSLIQDVLSERVPDFIAHSSNFIGSYLAGFFMLWRLALVAFPGVLLLIIPGVLYGRILMDLARKIREEYNKAGGIAEQAISSIRTVYSFSGELKTLAQFSAALDKSSKLGLRQGLIKGIAIGSNGVTFAIWAFMVWYGSHLVMYHGAKGGTVYAIAACIVNGGLALGTGLSNIKDISEAISAAVRMSEVIRRVPKIDSENMEGEVLESVVGEVEFKAVEFSYPSRPESLVLNEFNLKVPASKTVALVGASGSGKSTVIALLERFYDVTKGEILLDGVDIRNLKIKWLRSQMGLVSQEPILFATSVKENILFGREDASKEDVITAAKTANAHDFICQLPNGYDTQVGERGIQMSGGQKQRIAIARVVLKSPKILLLDEATSALDSESEKYVQEALERASHGHTTIVIAHRLSTVRNANLITVVQAGKVVEIGSHDELVSNEEGIYKSFVQLQPTERISTEGEEEYSTSAKDFTLSNNSFSSTSKLRSFKPNDQLETSNNRTPSFQRLLTLNAPEWKQAALGCLSATLSGAIQPIYEFSVGSMVSLYFLEDHNEIKAKTRTFSLLILSLSFFSLLTNIGQHYNFGAMGEYLTKRLREKMLSKILTFEVSWFDRTENSTGAICSSLTKDAIMIRSLVGDRMSLLVQTISTTTIAFVAGLCIAWKLALVIIILQPIIILCFYTRKVLLKTMSTKGNKAQLEGGELAAEAISNFRTITAFSSQTRIRRLFDLTQEEAQRENIKQSWFAGMILSISHSLTKCTVALIFWFGGRLMSNDELTSKALFQTFFILFGTGRAIAFAGTMTTDIAKGTKAVSSVFAVLDRKTCIEPDDSNGCRPKKIIGDIDFVEVDFKYPSRPEVIIFKNLSLSIEAGKSTALVGQSGCGKSTIISLIERFYDPSVGEVRIDGIDIKRYHLRSLRQHIALVSQEPILFAGTIRENITYGVEIAKEAEIEAAARVANAHEFISSLKDGYNTWCGDKGMQLSGGQRQRIAIARAIMKNPTILLLDEATSALDSHSEMEIQEALERVMVGRTCVVVAHRLNTVQKCDLIVVLDKGNVVEKGVHATLLAQGQGGYYYALANP